MELPTESPPPSVTHCTLVPLYSALPGTVRVKISNPVSDVLSVTRSGCRSLGRSVPFTLQWVAPRRVTQTNSASWCRSVVAFFGGLSITEEDHSGKDKSK